MSNFTEDEWDQGTYYKPAIWGFYATTNYLGALLNILLAWSIVRSQQRSVPDIIILGLNSGCAMMCVFRVFVQLNFFFLVGASLAPRNAS
jgi:hypothetical protein